MHPSTHPYAIITAKKEKNDPAGDFWVVNRICCVGRCRREYAWQACRSYVGHSYLQCPREVDPLPTMLLVRFTPKWSSDWVRGKPEKPLRHLSSFFSLTIKQLTKQITSYANIAVKLPNSRWQRTCNNATTTRNQTRPHWHWHTNQSDI